MRSTYKRLGEYIRKVDVRNTDLSVTNLRGLSMTKEFRESTSNVVGTDMSKYKVVQYQQFACDFMSTIRVHKLPVVLHVGQEPVIVSPAYQVFEVFNEDELLPEYLMMWFRRPEFDRFADFKCDSAIRGGFGWDELCDVELPIPPIEKQREIVKEYRTVVDRIRLNERLNEKLEEAAQAIYKQWFVDFEFPMTAEYAESIGKPELAGQPYKFSGGEMVYNEVLEQEIPKGWGTPQVGDLCTVRSSRRVFQRDYVDDGVPFYRGKEIIAKKNGKPLGTCLFITRDKFEELSAKNGAPQKDDILLTAVGTLGISYLVQDEEFYFKDGNIVWLNEFRDHVTGVFLYCFMQSESFEGLIDEITIGSTQNAITIDALSTRRVTMPEQSVLRKYQQVVQVLITYSSLCKRMSTPLDSLGGLVLSRIAQV